MANQRSSFRLHTTRDYGRLIHRPTPEHYARLHAARYSERMPRLPVIIITILSMAAFGACAVTAMPAAVALFNSSNNAIAYPTPAPFTPLPPSPSPTAVFQPAVFVTPPAKATARVAPNLSKRCHVAHAVVIRPRACAHEPHEGRLQATGSR